MYGLRMGEVFGMKNKDKEKKLRELTTIVNPLEQFGYERLMWENFIATLAMNTIVMLHLPLVKHYDDEKLRSYSDALVDAWGDATRITLSKRLEEGTEDFLGTLMTMFDPEALKKKTEKERQALGNALQVVLQRGKDALFITFKAAVEKYKGSRDET